MEPLGWVDLVRLAVAVMLLVVERLRTALACPALEWKGVDRVWGVGVVKGVRVCVWREGVVEGLMAQSMARCWNETWYGSLLEWHERVIHGAYHEYVLCVRLDLGASHFSRVR